MRTYTIIGADGFIGRKLCFALKTGGIFVHALDLNVRNGSWDRFTNANITVPLDPRLLTGCDCLIHLAGKVHSLAETRQDEEEYARINTQGTKHVLEAAKQVGVKRFVFFSSIKAMSSAKSELAIDSKGNPRPWTENDLVEPDTSYGRSKLNAEQLVLHGGYVPEPVVLRLCMVYGPDGKGNLQKMIEAVRKNRFPPLSEVGNRRSMVHVDDVVQAALLAAEHPSAKGEVFIVSDGNVYSTRQIYENICEALSRPIPSWSVPIWILKSLGRVGDLIGGLRGRRFVFDSDALHKLTDSAWFSSDKIQKTLGFQPRWTLKTALPEILRPTDGGHGKD